MRRATGTTPPNVHILTISIHALHEESDSNASIKSSDGNISIHALHEESDHSCRFFLNPQTISIHALHEESDFGGCLVANHIEFQSTLSMRRATIVPRCFAYYGAISIHALHEESDRDPRESGLADRHISIHALHEESDRSVHGQESYRYISIHALHEESDLLFQIIQRFVDALISIHALHEESDQIRTPTPDASWNFNPRSP